ncbi:MAG TPA: SRPBCC family protein, partial [Dermatophilaceae bacterium]|nr:SRPBCC family protein [Dermatophilaceae bacterium]
VPIPDADLELSRAGIAELDSGAQPGLVPVTATATVAVDVPPVRLWDFLDATLAEPLVSPGVQCVRRTALDDDARVHVVSVHQHEDGSRRVHVTQLVEAVRPHRFVERSLSADVETDVVMSISPAGEGSVLTETFTGWLPPGAATTSGSGPVEELMRARLETIRRLTEAGVSPQRDPRTGFLPPGSAPAPEDLDGRPPMTTPPAVLLPPPHLVVPAPMFGRPGLPLGWAGPLGVLPLFGEVGL